MNLIYEPMRMCQDKWRPTWTFMGMVIVKQSDGCYAYGWPDPADHEALGSVIDAAPHLMTARNKIESICK